MLGGSDPTLGAGGCWKTWSHLAVQLVKTGRGISQCHATGPKPELAVPPWPGFICFNRTARTSELILWDLHILLRKVQYDAQGIKKAFSVSHRQKLYTLRDRDRHTAQPSMVLQASSSSE